MAWTDPTNNRYTGDLNTEQRVLLTFSGNNADWDYKLSGNYSDNKSDQRNTGGIPDEALLGNRRRPQRYPDPQQSDQSVRPPDRGRTRP